MGLELRERVDRERGPQILETSEVSLGPADERHVPEERERQSAPQHDEPRLDLLAQERPLACGRRFDVRSQHGHRHADDPHGALS
jgi:hypothetical protein